MSRTTLPFLVSNWVDAGFPEIRNSGQGAGLGGVVAGEKGCEFIFD